jgi:hypothetical protein
MLCRPVRSNRHFFIKLLKCLTLYFITYFGFRLNLVLGMCTIKLSAQSRIDAFRLCREFNICTQLGSCRQSFFWHTKPACTRDLVRLTLFHRGVSKCRPPASAQALQLLIIFLNQRRSYFFFGLFVFSCVILSLTSCRECGMFT